MSASLNRLLKIRRLVEESSRMELEQRVALATRIEHAQERERAAAHHSREEATKAVLDEGVSAQERANRRNMEWANAEAATARRQPLRAMAEGARLRVMDARSAFLERRTERRQVESVLNAEQARWRTDQERRIQRDLDDWFGSKQVRQRRKATRKEPQS